jgi:hypothetical protein
MALTLKAKPLTGLDDDDIAAYIADRYQIENLKADEYSKLLAITNPESFIENRRVQLNKIQEKVKGVFEDTLRKLQKGLRIKDPSDTTRTIAVKKLPEKLIRKLAQERADAEFVYQMTLLETRFPGVFKGYSVIPSLKETTKKDIFTPALEGYFDQDISGGKAAKALLKESKKRKKKSESA